MEYLIERLGDISGKTYHHSLDEALAQLRKEYPKLIDMREAIAHIVADAIIAYLKEHNVDLDEIPNTPDPEDDRILIWEIQSDGQAKVVWHFSGWHWNADEFDLPQGTLPGDNISLYELASD